MVKALDLSSNGRVVRVGSNPTPGIFLNISKYCTAESLILSMIALITACFTDRAKRPVHISASSMHLRFSEKFQRLIVLQSVALVMCISKSMCHMTKANPGFCISKGGEAT